MEDFPEEVILELRNEAGVISTDVHVVKITSVALWMNIRGRHTALSYLIGPDEN